MTDTTISDVGEKLPPAHAEMSEFKIMAVIIRADGTRVPLGALDYWHKNPVYRLRWKLSRPFRDMARADNPKKVGKVWQQFSLILARLLSPPHSMP